MNQLVALMGVSCLVTLIITPIFRRIALKVQLVDMPNERRIHRTPTATSGGVAIAIALVVVSIVFSLSDLLPLFLGGLILLLVGLIDDAVELSAGKKFLGQLIAVCVYVARGSTIEYLVGPTGEPVFLGILGIPLTIFWILAVINVLNFLDGLDGLAAGVAAISGLALFVMSFSFGNLSGAGIAALVFGGALGFLPHNLSPAKIFLGDAGALLLGYMLAVCAIEGVLQGAHTLDLMLPVLILALPVADTAVVVSRRISQGVPIYRADKEHFHHRMLRLGYSPGQVVLIAYGLTALCSGAALVLFFSSTPGLFLSWLLFAAFSLLLWAISRPLEAAPYFVESERSLARKGETG